MYQSPTAPLSIGGVLDHGFHLLKACFGKVIGLAFISAIISSIPNLMMPQPDFPAEPSFPPELVGGTLIAGLIAVVLYGAIIARIDAVVKGNELSLTESISVGASRFFPMIFCLILFGLALLGGLLALVIPCLILMLSLSLAPYLVITDKLGPLEALKQSHRLVWGNWWRAAAIVTVVMFISISAYLLVGAVTGVGVFMSSPQLQDFGLFAIIGMALLTAVITPVNFSFAIALILDLKLRKEGGDLEDRIEAIAEA